MMNAGNSSTLRPTFPAITTKSKRMSSTRKTSSLGIFPFRLHQILVDAEDNGLEGVISWVANGTLFKVHDPVKFSKLIMKQYFRHDRYKSFLRQLSMYKFQRVTEGPFRGAYGHPQFLKAHIELSKYINRGDGDDDNEICAESSSATTTTIENSSSSKNNSAAKITKKGCSSKAKAMTSAAVAIPTSVDKNVPPMALMGTNDHTGRITMTPPTTDHGNGKHLLQHHHHHHQQQQQQQNPPHETHMQNVPPPPFSMLKHKTLSSITGDPGTAGTSFILRNSSGDVRLPSQTTTTTMVSTNSDDTLRHSQLIDNGLGLSAELSSKLTTDILDEIICTFGTSSSSSLGSSTNPSSMPYPVSPSVSATRASFSSAGTAPLLSLMDTMDVSSSSLVPGSILGQAASPPSDHIFPAWNDAADKISTDFISF